MRVLLYIHAGIYYRLIYEYITLTIPDSNAANIEPEMRSQQTDSEEGHTATDMRPHNRLVA